MTIAAVKLPHRFAGAPMTRSRPLNEPAPAAFFGGGAAGYIEHPTPVVTRISQAGTRAWAGLYPTSQTNRRGGIDW